MDKKQKILFYFAGIVVLCIVFEILIIPGFLKKYDYEKMEKIIVRDSESIFSKAKIDDLIKNPGRLLKEFMKKKEEIEFEKNNIIDMNKTFKEKIKKNLNIIENRDFNYTEFDQNINKIVKDLKLNFNLGIPNKGKEEIRDYVFEDQKGKIKKAHLIYTPIRYRIRNIDFMEFGRFIEKIETNFEFLIIGEMKIDKNNGNDGNIDLEIEFIVVNSLTGKTKNREVGLVDEN